MVAGGRESVKGKSRKEGKRQQTENGVVVGYNFRSKRDAKEMGLNLDRYVSGNKDAFCIVRLFELSELRLFELLLTNSGVLDTLQPE